MHDPSISPPTRSGGDSDLLGHDPDTPPLGPPTVAGELGTFGRRYRVVRPIGRGGMGAVYLGFDTDLDRPVALKTMLPRFAADPMARERFLREARAAKATSEGHGLGTKVMG